MITLENGMVMRWWEHSQKRFDRRNKSYVKRRNTLDRIDQYTVPNNKYAGSPIPPQPPTQKVFQWHTQNDHTIKQSHCETVYGKELVQWLFLEMLHPLRQPSNSWGDRLTGHHTNDGLHWM